MHLSSKTVERFWAKVVVTSETECWLWTGAKSGSGYGHMTINKKQYSAHKVSFFLATGKWVASKKDVMHSCNKPLCQNPNHLIEGTRSQNMDQMFSEGRRFSNTKITASQFNEIRREYVPYKNSCHRLAKKYGVCAMTIHKIVSGVAGRGYHGI